MKQMEYKRHEELSVHFIHPIVVKGVYIFTSNGLVVTRKESMEKIGKLRGRKEGKKPLRDDNES